MGKPIMVNFVRTIIIILLLVISYQNVSCKKYNIDPAVDLTLEQRIIRHGYPVESHQVVTEDDYILELFHIPHGLKKETNENKNKSIVLIVHGMGGSPHNFVVLGPKASASYYFADRGCDVWLFGARATESSYKKHKKYDWNNDDEFWFFSFHEIGVYDLPATIDFILNYTGQKKLSLIGHSAGGNVIFAMFSERPEYNDKVKVAISWGSSPLVKHFDYPLLSLLTAFGKIWKGLNRYLGMAELFPFIQSFKPSLRLLCADPEWRHVCCILTDIIGSHKSVLQRPDDIQIIASNIPRLSIMQLFHFMDNINNASFRQYDFGIKKNLLLYGQPNPPHYNLSAATAPTAFFFGPHDYIITLEDMLESVEKIPNTVLIYEVPFKKFTHVDFLIGRNATQLVYKPTLKLIQDIDRGIIPPPIKVPTTNRS